MKFYLAISFFGVCLWTGSALAEMWPHTDAGSETPNQAFMDALVRDCFDAAERRPAKEACSGKWAEQCMDAQENWGHSMIGMTLCTRAEATAWEKLVEREFLTTRDVLQQADERDQEPATVDLPYRAPSLLKTYRAWQLYTEAKCLSEYLTWRGGTLAKLAGAKCQLASAAEHALFLWSLRQP